MDRKINFSLERKKMGDFTDRTRMLIGEHGVKILKQSAVAVFGLGGVGSYVAEALGRAGIGHLALIDKDVISESNINRQLIALTSTVGMKKTQVMAARLKDINPQVTVELFDLFYLPQTADQVDLNRFDYVVDAVDTVSAKVELAVRANACGVPIISCMGTGNKMDPSRLEIADIYRTSVCPLARAMRSQLKKAGVQQLKVLYSTESSCGAVLDENGRHAPGSISFVPSVAGLMCAGEVIRDLLKVRM